MSCNYPMIKDFGCSSVNLANPLSYCLPSTLDSGFNHGLGGNNISGPDNPQCVRAMAAYGAMHWDGACEYLANDSSRAYPNIMQSCNGASGGCNGTGIGNDLTKGEFFIRNVASEKYLRYMSANCERVYEPFDPTVADSPLISYWQPKQGNCGGASPAVGACVPIYGVDPNTVDSDPVMDKILAKPWIAMDILINIHANMDRFGGIQRYQGTKLHRFLTGDGFQTVLRNGAY